MDNRSRSKLAHLLIAKSISESVLVGVLAIGFFFVAFPPFFHGWGEATAHSIEGWTVNDRALSDRVRVQLFIDDQFIATCAANQPRPDIVTAGKAPDEWHGYSFPIPSLPAGKHTARVYAVTSSFRGAKKSLQMVGDPISFEIDENGVAHQLKQRNN